MIIGNGKVNYCGVPMKETIYTTWARRDNHWVNDMLEKWQKSGDHYLCFPRILFEVHTLPDTPFWMYFYYAKARTDIPSLQGEIEFRVKVLSWRPDHKYSGNDIRVFRGNEDGRVWFLCDRFEEIVKNDGSLLSLSDFRHAYGKNLISTMRNSIPQVILEAKTRAGRYYP